MTSAAEEMLDIANLILQHRGIMPVSWNDNALAKAKLALDLRRNLRLAMMSVIEGWDLDRIARELHN